MIYKLIHGPYKSQFYDDGIKLQNTIWCMHLICTPKLLYWNVTYNI